jgi:hypothetical protein
MVLRTINTVLRSIRRGKGRGSLVDAAGATAISKGNPNTREEPTGSEFLTLLACERMPKDLAHPRNR